MGLYLTVAVLSFMGGLAFDLPIGGFVGGVVGLGVCMSLLVLFNKLGPRSPAR
jgi:hypothetical protein